MLLTMVPALSLQYLDWKQRFGSLRRSEEAQLFVAREFGKVVGCASVSATPYSALGLSSTPRSKGQQPKRDKQAKVPIIANLAVRKRSRRRGIAEKLMGKCESEARRWGYQEVSGRLPRITLAGFMSGVLCLHLRRHPCYLAIPPGCSRSGCVQHSRAKSLP